MTTNLIVQDMDEAYAGSQQTLSVATCNAGAAALV
jgi:hypothetical protein